MRKAKSIGLVLGGLMLLMHFSLRAQMFTEVKDLDSSCSQVQLKLTVAFPYGAGASCPPLSGYTLTNSGNAYTVDVSYNTCGAWPQVGCTRSDTIQFALPLNAQQLTARMLTDNCGTLSPANSHSNVAVCNITGIEMKNADAAAVQLIPNPAFGLLRIAGITQPAFIRISDLKGAVLLETETAGNNVDVSALSEGVYFVSVRTREGNLTKKLVIVR